MTVSESAVRRLIEDGRRTGRLTTADLHAALPIASMGSAAVAAVVDRLEDAGIDVEIDPRLTGRTAATGGEPHGPATGAIAIGDPAGPAVAAPGVRPSHGGWIGMGDHTPAHGTRRAPTWEVDGMDMLPIACVVGVALVLMVVLG